MNSSATASTPTPELPELPEPIVSGWRTVRRNPSAALLVVQLASLLIYPFVDNPDSTTGRSIVALLGLLALVMSVRVVAQSPVTVWVSATVGLAAFGLSVVDVVTGWAQPWHFWSDIAHMVFYLWAAVALVGYMVKDVHVTVDELFAVGAAFTVLVWAFAHAYSALQYVQPGSFIAAINAEGNRSWMELLFLSCTTLTSTGLSDVVPVRPLARAVVMVQQIAGMLYIAMVISRLVTLRVGRERAVRRGR
ncbi:potassium channel family protein [Propionibacteriaceae bacterium G1746]|uniref:potassium channel family protein n=1 Tax=Aestuariimicrobium sp. G57 TaxID=3418485 RepID=UPI003C28918C